MNKFLGDNNLPKNTQEDSNPSSPISIKNIGVELKTFHKENNGPR